MNAVDNSLYALVAAAAAAAGPCPPGEEAEWGRRVLGLSVDLHVIAAQARQDIDRISDSHTHRFVAILVSVEIEESSRRGLLTLRPPSGDLEHVRTEQDTNSGRALLERARSLVGRWVLVHRYNAPIRGGRQSVRMLAHLQDLGSDGAMPADTAKKILLQDAGGDTARARRAWSAAGLPESGPVTPQQLERAREAARSDAAEPGAAG